LHVAIIIFVKEGEIKNAVFWKRNCYKFQLC
jgi:hypothetical protein